MNHRAPFSRAAILALVVGGFALFLALLFAMGRGDSQLADTQNGGAHAAGNGLTGYAGLTRLLAASHYQITRSRSPTGLETSGILVITPPMGADAEEVGAILEKRRNLGPTLVILPKWRASLPPGNLPREAAARFKRGWVVLGGSDAPAWPAALPAPFALTPTIAELGADESPVWDGFGRSGALPTRVIAYAAKAPDHETLIADAAGHPLAVLVRGPAGSDYNENAHWTIFLTEPDLANNYGLADPVRAAAALALMQELDYDARGEVTFDMTLNGFGGSENLLTLAFRPPFLAATLCLVLALVIVFWRAMLRFGPAAAQAPATAFGKRQLVENGAGLILRARRWSLLAAPYVRLAERRAARALRLQRHDPASIDRALAIRAPQEEPFTPRAARLAAATSPAEILSAAAALDTLPRKLT
ncbi:MAG: DUF4350 domain-containing protein [Erythrobacter sp.]